MITSPSNPRVVAAARLHRARERRETGKTLLEGPHLLDEALNAAVDVDLVFALDRDDAMVARAAAAGSEIVAVSHRVLERLAGTESPRGPVAVMSIPPQAVVPRIDTLVMSGIADPGNVGSLIRSAAAFGFAVVSTDGSADPWAPKVLRSGAGGHFRTRIACLEEPLATLRDAECSIVGLVPSGGVAPATLSTAAPIALWVGSEAHGLDGRLLDEADRLVSLPMPGGTESLNAAVAGAIAMYERRRVAT